jgi:hypothetical protein
VTGHKDNGTGLTFFSFFSFALAGWEGAESQPAFFLLHFAPENSS